MPGPQAMSFFLAVVVALLALGLIVLFAGALLRALWHTERPFDERHSARTRDGWRLALYRYRGSERSHHPPVILCHGIAANARNLDLDDDHSLACHLRDTGRDVWVLELRGVGMSDSPSRRRNRRGGWSFDVHVREDLPALLTAVGNLSGASTCDWVGYSMGGLIAYAGFGGETELPLTLRRLVTIGAPVVTRPRSARDHGIVGLLARLLRRTSTIRQRRLAAAAALLAPSLNRLVGGAIGVPGASSPLQVRRAMIEVVSNVSGGVVAQFRTWMDTGRFTSLDGLVDYAAGMEKINAPALVLGGNQDRVAPPGAVRRGFELLGSEHKVLAVLGRDAGQETDYGHMDLAFGRHAPAEIYPQVSDFLNREDLPS